MLVGIILYILWPFSFISFLIAWLYRKNGAITASSYNSNNVFADYQKIKKIGKITIIIALVYYIIFCAILGWETSSLSLSYIIILFSVVILDWYLIAVAYKSSDNEKLFGIRIFWISFFYKISRIVYVISVISYLLWSVKGGPYLIAVVTKEILTFLPDSKIESIRYKLVEDSTASLTFFYKKKLKFRVENELDRFNTKRVYTAESNHFFRNNYVVINYNSPEFHIYKRHFYLFKEYLYTVRGNGDLKDGTFKIYPSLNRDTIYIGKNNKNIRQNYIFNDHDVYIHTIMNDNHSENVQMNKL